MKCKEINYLSLFQSCIKAEKNSGQIRSMLLSWKHGFHDQSHTVTFPNSSSILPPYQRHSKNLPPLVASFLCITHPSVHFSFSRLQPESLIFFLVCQRFASSCYLLPTFQKKKNHNSQEQSYFETQPGCSMAYHYYFTKGLFVWPAALCSCICSDHSAVSSIELQTEGS